MTSGRWSGGRTLVIGGTGTFGAHFVQRLLLHDPAGVTVLSRDEHKQAAMCSRLGENPKVGFILGDIRDPLTLRRAVRAVDTVVQAAALKIVPSCEENVEEAIRTNVIGVQNVLHAVDESRVRRLIAISTDKAVEPVNVMGLTKALQERLVTHAQVRSPAALCVIRYGNILGSRSSVAEVFVRRARSGLPICVTDPEMTRFFFGIDQACDRILEQGAAAVGGEIFVPRLRAISMGRLAEVIRARFPGAPPVEVIGVRPGEKTHETLVSIHELHRTREVEGGFVVLPSLAMGARYDCYAAFPRPRHAITSDQAEQLSDAEVLLMLKEGGLLDDGSA